MEDPVKGPPGEGEGGSPVGSAEGPGSAPPGAPEPARLEAPPSKPLAARPSFVFFGFLAALSLIADVASKAWAEIVLTRRPAHEPSIILLEDHLTFTLAYNRGGAWGLLQNSSEYVRRPFFLIVSLAAVVFIVSLYGRLAPGQRALKWGLPLVLGGALGNLTDRIVRTSVVDFIDYRADWITKMNELIARVFTSWNVTDHWPTFNVADICICTGVGLMAIDMIGSKHPPEPLGSDEQRGEPPHDPVKREGPPAAPASTAGAS
jgi:signal peptidase II